MIMVRIIYVYIYKDAGNMDCMQGTNHAMDEKTL
jgi:hypothetical protein